MYFLLICIYMIGESQISVYHLLCFYNHKISCNILLAGKHHCQQILIIGWYILQCCKTYCSIEVMGLEGEFKCFILQSLIQFKIFEDASVAYSSLYSNISSQEVIVKVNKSHQDCTYFSFIMAMCLPSVEPKPFGQFQH